MLKVYLADLQAYDEGYLVGKWIKLPLDFFDLLDVMSEIYKKGEDISKTDKHFICFIKDYEWSDKEFSLIDENTNIIELNSNIQQLLEFDIFKQRSVSFLLDCGIVVNLNDAIEHVDDVIIHLYQDMEDVARHLLKERYKVDELPEIISHCIDYERVIQKLEIDGYYWQIGNDVFEYVGK